ncbi:MAG: methyltransferase domain-containing protein [Hyphomicrobiales bacterium]|nr:methyltransferase domain-containing protein [Hyphomicrobiales bacterium]
MYDIHTYGRMIADRPRMQAYSQALQRTIRPGSVVIDIGTGTGIVAILACRLGAARVYAIEPSDAIHVARQIAEANGVDRQIEFIQKLSTDVTLPERADVILSDLRGRLPLFDGHIPAVIDARARLLAPGGQLVPQRDHLRASLVEAPDVYSTLTNPWFENEYGLDMSAGLPYVMNTTVSPKTQTAEWILTPPETWTTLDYRTIESPRAGGSVEATCSRPGTAHGLLLWFDAELVDGVGFTNAPGGPDLIYGSLFYPLSAPVDVSAGDRVHVKLGADLVGEDYVWRWETTIREPNAGRVRAALRQSSLDGMLVVPSRLRKRAQNYQPRLDSEGVLNFIILQMMDGSARVADIAQRAYERFPESFPSRQKALDRVRLLSELYSE